MVALSNTSGNVAERYSYDVFGEPNRTSDLGNPYMFTGREYDSESGLYYYRARYYKPSIGRFLQTDPIRYEDGLNLYTYVHNNPINSVDPEGTKEPISCMLCISCIAAVGATCTAICAEDPIWDCPDDTFSDCWNKCFRAVLFPDKDSPKEIKGISVGCKAACAACGLTKGGIGKKLK